MAKPRLKRVRTVNGPIHWFYKTLFVIYLMAIISTSVIHAFDDKVNAAPLPSSPVRFKPIYNPKGRSKIRTYVEGVARTRGVDPEVAEWIVAHESQHHPDAIGDGGDSRGLWQINKAWHPEVSDACAYSVTCSTNWSLQRIRSGHVDEWSTWKYCKERFDDCPFDSK